MKQYLIQRLGVFGAAYFTQMQEMGLFEEGPNCIQRITAEAGLAAADAFRSAIGEDLEVRFVATIERREGRPCHPRRLDAAEKALGAL